MSPLKIYSKAYITVSLNIYLHVVKINVQILKDKFTTSKIKLSKQKTERVNGDRERKLQSDQIKKKILGKQTRKQKNPSH